MARSANANATSTVEKNETVEDLEILELAKEVVETDEQQEVVETDEQQENTSNGSGSVLVFNKSLINKSVVLPTRTITFNDKGLCEVTEVEAKRLLSIPGYSLKK